MWSLPITPIPTPRPRLGKHGAYNPTKYRKYKNDIKTFIALYKIPKDDYDYIHAKFFVPYPKNTPKKHLIDEYPLRMCFDCDNVIKGLCDALEESKVIKDDRLFSSMFIEKFRTTNDVGRIEFELQTFKDNPIHER